MPHGDAQVYRDRDVELVVRQRDLICGTCPLETCNERSLWCMFRFLTDPNEAQRRMVTKTLREKKLSKAEYERRYYQKNRERKIAAAKARYRRLRETCTT